MQRKDLTSHQIADLSALFGHDLSPEQLVHFNTYHSDESGYFAMDERPRNGRKFLLMYMGCWSRGIEHYMRTCRPELMDEYWTIRMIDYSFILHCMRDRTFPEPEIIKAAWKNADVVIYAPASSAYAEFGSEHLLRYLKPEAKTAAFSMLHQGCWWPISPCGEEGVIKCLEQGKKPDEIFASLKDGTFDPMFEVRFAGQISFALGKQSYGSIPVTEFIQNHYRTHKLFFTHNHPTYNVQAYCADACFGLLGHTPKGDEHSLSLPPDAFMVGDVFPESSYEFDYYKFEYPMRWTDTSGGFDNFYRGEIDRITDEWIRKQPS